MLTNRKGVIRVTWLQKKCPAKKAKRQAAGAPKDSAGGGKNGTSYEYTKCNVMKYYSLYLNVMYMAVCIDAMEMRWVI